MKSTGTLREQLKAMGMSDKKIDLAVLASGSTRYMHFEGRPLLEALPRAVDDIEDYDWYEGEVFGGMVLGWNFGDGHLNGKALIDAIQPQCEFEPGEVRVVSVESQPLFGRFMEWKIYDAATGLIDEGRTELAAMRDVPPWPTGEYAEAFEHGQSDAGREASPR